MSYILDALRKLDQNRQHEESLTFLTFQGQAPRKRKRQRLWPYLLIVVLMLNAGAIFWWIGHWQSPRKSMNSETPSVREVKPAIQASAPAPAPAAGGVQRRASAKKTIVAPKEVKERPHATKRDIIATTRPAVQQPPASKPAPVAKETPVPFEKPSPASPVPAETMPPADTRLRKLADLPASVASGLPEFKISLHYYIAEPQSRVVWINNRTLHEGEYLSEGLKVEQINEGGVVMNYRGWRFQLELNKKP